MAHQLTEQEVEVWRDAALRFRELAQGLRNGTVSPDEALYESIRIDTKLIFLPVLKRGV